MLARAAPMVSKELSQAGREMGETKVPKRAATGGSLKAWPGPRPRHPATAVSPDDGIRRACAGPPRWRPHRRETLTSRIDEQHQPDDEDSFTTVESRQLPTEQQEPGEGQRVGVDHPLLTRVAEPSDLRIDGKATFTTEMSSTTMNWAAHAAPTSPKHWCGSPPGRGCTRSRCARWRPNRGCHCAWCSTTSIPRSSCCAARCDIWRSAVTIAGELAWSGCRSRCRRERSSRRSSTRHGMTVSWRRARTWRWRRHDWCHSATVSAPVSSSDTRCGQRRGHAGILRGQPVPAGER